MVIQRKQRLLHSSTWKKGVWDKTPKWARIPTHRRQNLLLETITPGTPNRRKRTESFYNFTSAGVQLDVHFIEVAFSFFSQLKKSRLNLKIYLQDTIQTMGKAYRASEDQQWPFRSSTRQCRFPENVSVASVPEYDLVAPILKCSASPGNCSPPDYSDDKAKEVEETCYTGNEQHCKTAAPLKIAIFSQCLGI